MNTNQFSSLYICQILPWVLVLVLSLPCRAFFPVLPASCPALMVSLPALKVFSVAFSLLLHRPREGKPQGGEQGGDACLPSGVRPQSEWGFEDSQFCNIFKGTNEALVMVGGAMFGEIWFPVLFTPDSCNHQSINNGEVLWTVNSFKIYSSVIDTYTENTCVSHVYCMECNDSLVLYTCVAFRSPFLDPGNCFCDSIFHF